MKEPLFGFEWNQADADVDLEAGLFTLVAADAHRNFHAVGTGFVIRALDDLALAVTAGHVMAGVEGLQEMHSNQPYRSVVPEFVQRKRSVQLALSGLALLTTKNSKVVVSRVEGVAFDERGDIALAQLRPQKGHELHYLLREFLLEDELPKVGELVCAASYVDLRCVSTDSGGFEVKRRAVVRVGRVLSSYPEGQRLCKGPCFETSIPFFSGMSGGPVFHYGDTGPMRVIGLVCSDPDLDGPEKNDRSVAGRSLVAQLPVRRVSGGTDGQQVVDMSFAPTVVAGSFLNSADLSMISGRGEG